MAKRLSPVEGFLEYQNPGEQRHEFADQAVKFTSVYLSSKTACFRLTFTILGGEHNEIPIYLQIASDDLDSFRYKTCKLKDRGLPQLDELRRRLGRKGGRGDLTHLRFVLRNGVHLQRIVPHKLPDYEALDDPSRHVLDTVASIAASPSFSLYIPANRLSRKLLDVCVEAVQRCSELTKEEFLSYQRAVQLQRLYGGGGGRMLAVHDDDAAVDRDLAVDDHDSNSRQETDSCATLGFDVVPRERNSPPHYDAGSVDGKKPMANLADTANVDNSVIECPPPEYGDIEQARDTPMALKRVRQWVDEGGSPQPSPKRVSSLGSCVAISASASATNVRRLDAKKRRLEFENADVDGCMLLHDLSRRVIEQENRQVMQEQENHQLRHEIKLLQETVEELRQQNTSCAKRQSEVEEICGGLEHQQDLVKDELENFDVQVDELEGKLDEVEKHMLCFLEELGDLVRRTIRDMLQEDMLQEEMVRDAIAVVVKECVDDWLSDYIRGEGEVNLAGPARAYLCKIVTDQVATVKANICKALRE
ncbi:hypothetical protein HER10_EVM0012784 [Colletotrichum scovillei]|uniref:uncharacterized protein n=1 Tax=Colletotrichum scovillei TaxID=1209932 RepID=UPI0015C3B170|nr:uncharacterized protein HER10_EVM0012784 [Colletotrichum scovillei]KAF4772760.1 hypothetical protein HER10_EVM0012784 [Colletotrichum scovillei]KAG7038365.1 LysM domain-containing protein [Colletotrichum scovillei]